MLCSAPSPQPPLWRGPTFGLTGRRGAKRRGNQTAKLFGAPVEPGVGQPLGLYERFHRLHLLHTPRVARCP
jgi:hypothetical protein